MKPRLAHAATTQRDQPLSLDPAVIKLVDALVRRQAIYPPRGMSRIEASAYVGVSPGLFDVMVGDGRMPGPKLINTRTVWDRFALDRAFEALPDRDSRNPWDEFAACHATPVQVLGRGR